MNNPVNPNDAAFASDTTQGLSKRELLAALAMQSLMSNTQMGAELNRIFDLDGRIARQGSDDETPMHYLGRIACAQADAQIEALNQPTEPAQYPA